MSPKVSIIITTCNRAQHLRQTLESLGRLHVPADLPTELLVVDNASTDSTAEVVKQCRFANLSVRYLYEPKRGQSNARNSGMANTTGEVILFTDDDVRPCENWIEAMAGPILAGKADAVTGQINIAPELKRPWMDGCHLGWLCMGDPQCQKAACELTGANMGFSRMVLERVSGFDPELGPGQLGFSDDSLFSLQLLEAGYRTQWQMSASVTHHFEEHRLRRPSWLDTATKRGKTRAYLVHHWLHERVERAFFKLAHARLRLLYWRTLHVRKLAVEEGCDEPELWLQRSVAFHQQYLLERKRPRNYSKRGLVRLDWVPLTNQTARRVTGNRDLVKGL